MMLAQPEPSRFAPNGFPLPSLPGTALLQTRMHLQEKQGSAQGNHRRHLPRSARVHEDQDEESVCSEKNQGSQRKRTAPGEKGKDQHHRTEGIHRDSHVYKRHRPIPSRTELAGQRQQSWKSVERWPPRNASEPLRYVAMPEISPGYSTSKLAICSVEGLSARLWPADWVPAATAAVGRSLLRSVPTHAVPGFLQPAAITVGPKSVTAAITLALRRLTGDHPTSRELSDVPY